MINIENISIDNSIMENERNIKLVPLQSDWSDIGNWDSMNLLKKKLNQVNSNSILIDSKNTDIHSGERLIVGIGLQDLIIVDDVDTTLILKKNQSEKVKSAVEKLTKENNEITLEHKYELRPWGKFEILLNSSETKVKRIFVDPQKSLSYQFHKFRSEHWTIVAGKAEIVLDGKKTIHTIGESIVIPKGVKHSLSNITNEVLTVIEVQFGSYFGEDDIIRVSDPYNR